MATFIYSVFADKYFDFAIYVKRVICFNANGPFYYVLLYLQLLLIVPIIFYFLQNTGNKKYSIGIEILGLVIVLVIAGLTTNYTNILSVTGGGGKLFGGTYLCLLYIGMMFGKYCDRISLQKASVIVLFAVSLIVTMLWWNFISVDKLRIDARVPFGAGFNPPSISLGIYAILVACTIYLFEKLLINSDKLLMLFAKISILGKHTLYVFLYHRLFLDYIFPQIPMITAIENIWFKRIIYFVGMVGGYDNGIHIGTSSQAGEERVCIIDIYGSKGYDQKEKNRFGLYAYFGNDWCDNPSFAGEWADIKVISVIWKYHELNEVIQH